MIITVDPSQSEDIAAFAMVKQYRMQALNVTLNGGTGSGAWQAVQGGEGYTQTVVTPVTGIELVYEDPNAIVSYTVENDDTSNYDVASNAGIILSSIEPTTNAWTYTCVFHADSVPVSSVDIDLLVYGNIARGTEQQGSPATAEEITAQVLAGLETRVTALEEEMPDKADVATTYTKTEVDNAVVHKAGSETITGAKTFSEVIVADNFIRSKHKVLNSYSVDVSLGRWVPIYTITRSGQSSPQASFYIALRKNGHAIIQVILPPSGSLKIQGALIGSALAPADLFRVSAEDSTTWTLWAYFASDDGIRADCLGAYGSNTQLSGSNITPLTGTKGYTITSEGYTDENGVVHTFTAYAEMENNLVHTSGDETIEGLKTFKGSSNISRLLYLQSANIETGVLPASTRYETIEFVDKNTTPSTLNRMGEMGYLITNAGLSAVYLRAYKYDGSSYGQLALCTNAEGNRYVTIPTRGYNAGSAYTDDVATIGTLDAYTPMVRTTGTQTVLGMKRLWTVTYQGGITASSADAGTYTVLTDLGIKIGTSGVHVGLSIMGRTGGYDGFISITSDENGITGVTAVGTNVGGTSTTIGVCYDTDGELYLVARRLTSAGQSYIVQIKGITHGTSVTYPVPFETAPILTNITNYTEAVRI